MKKLWAKLSKHERIILPLIFINVVVLIVYLFFKPSKIQINTISVANRTDVKIVEDIVISFNGSPSDSFIKSCKFRLEPTVDFSIEKSGAILTLDITTYLNHDTNYFLNVNCEDINETTYFQTSSYKNATEEELVAVQMNRDKSFADELIQIYEEYPWREKLPIVTDKFIITYSQTLNTFLVENKTTSASSILEGEVRAELDKIEAPSDILINWR